MSFVYIYLVEYIIGTCITYVPRKLLLLYHLNKGNELLLVLFTLIKIMIETYADFII